MTDDLQRRFIQARDAAHRAAGEVAAMLPGADVIRRRATRRRAVRRGAAVVSCLAVGITAITISAGGNEGRSTVLASKPPSSSPEPTLTTDASTTTSVTGPVITTATKSRPTTTTTLKPVSDACQASRIPSEALGFTRLDDRRLIVTGSGGGVAVSADNGDTWTPACIPGSISEASLRDPSFLPDGQNGWLVGNLGDSPGPMVVARTNDGGEHWETGSVRSPAGLLKAVTFTDPLHGWAVGSKGESNYAMILRSVDGGRTWTEGKLDAGSKGSLHDVTFFDAQHGWAVGWGIVVRTSDGGATWTSQELQFGTYGTIFTRVVFVDNDHGWIVGLNQTRRDAGYGIILETKDGGRTWSRQPFAPREGSFGGPSFTSMQALSEQVLVLVGGHGRMWRSSDGGHQWDDVAAITVDGPAGSSEADDPEARPYLNHVVFTDAEHGWVTIRSRAGAPGQLCVTSDGGRTWEGRSLSGQRFACKNTL